MGREKHEQQYRFWETKKEKNYVIYEMFSNFVFVIHRGTNNAILPCGGGTLLAASTWSHANYVKGLLANICRMK